MLIKLLPGNSWLIEPFSAIEVTTECSTPLLSMEKNMLLIRNRITQILCENFHTLTDEGAGGTFLICLEDENGDIEPLEVAWQTSDQSQAEIAA